MSRRWTCRQPANLARRIYFAASGARCWTQVFWLPTKYDEDDQERESKLPDLQPGQALRFVKFHPEKHMTEPPKRYTQASLIRELEKRGLGRPSTYASIVEVLLERKYVESNRGKNKTLISTKVGCQVLAYLLTGFADIFDYGFTARMEEQLDEIAGGQVNWQSVLNEFWQTLGPRVT